MPSVTRFFHPVLSARKLASAPVRVTVAGANYVLWRDRDRRAVAFVDACPHRRAPLSAGRVRDDGRLECAYHGWSFDASGCGRSPSQPTLTKCDASAMQLVERGGYLWLADPATAAGALPQVAWDDFEPAGSFSMRFEAPLHVCLDNFSEDEHTPWVHTRLGWEPRDVESIEFAAENFDDRTEVSYRGRQRSSPVRVLIGVREGDVFNNEWETRFDPVRTVYTLFWTDPRTDQRRGMTARAVIFMVPETARTTMFHVFVTVRFEQRRQRLMAAIVKTAALVLAWAEVRDDRIFIPTVADTPEDMKGMRLGRFDKPLVHNHKLLRSIYWGEDANVRELVRRA